MEQLLKAAACKTTSEFRQTVSLSAHTSQPLLYIETSTPPFPRSHQEALECSDELCTLLDLLHNHRLFSLLSCWLVPALTLRYLLDAPHCLRDARLQRFSTWQRPCSLTRVLLIAGSAPLSALVPPAEVILTPLRFLASLGDMEGACARLDPDAGALCWAAERGAVSGEGPAA